MCVQEDQSSGITNNQVEGIVYDIVHQIQYAQFMFVENTYVTCS